jgi:hypothetical protein
LKQARQRAPRRFSKDGARSSLPQYRQTNFSALAAARDDSGGRRASLLFFEGNASIGVAATSLLFAFMWFSFSGRRFGANRLSPALIFLSRRHGKAPLLAHTGT